jgi:Flp pilus assembly protein TadD
VVRTERDATGPSGATNSHCDRFAAEMRQIRLDPNLAEAHYTLGIVAWQTGDLAETAKRMRAATALRPAYAEAQYMLGTVLKQQGDLDGAIAALREAIRLAPEDPGPHNALGQTLRVKGDIGESQKAFAEGARLKTEREAAQGKLLRRGR